MLVRIRIAKTIEILKHRFAKRKAYEDPSLDDAYISKLLDVWYLMRIISLAPPIISKKKPRVSFTFNLVWGLCNILLNLANVLSEGYEHYEQAKVKVERGERRREEGFKYETLLFLCNQWYNRSLTDLGCLKDALIELFHKISDELNSLNAFKSIIEDINRFNERLSSNSSKRSLSLDVPNSLSRIPIINFISGIPMISSLSTSFISAILIAYLSIDPSRDICFKFSNSNFSNLV